jgi:hypothetical protein
MDGFCLFCAFCERHGPSILFCTSKLPIARTKGFVHQLSFMKFCLIVFFFLEDVFDESSMSEDSFCRLSEIFTVDEKSAGCTGCKSVENKDGFVSFSERENRFFCTSSKFPETGLYALARQICVRIAHFRLFFLLLVLLFRFVLFRANEGNWLCLKKESKTPKC